MVAVLRAQADVQINAREAIISRCPATTTCAGIPVPDNRNPISAGPRGPVLMRDFMPIGKMAYLDRERVPERSAMKPVI